MSEERYTDVGNARRLVAGHGDQMRWVSAWSTWLVYDGRRWRRDSKGTVVEFAKATAAALWTEAMDTPASSDERKLATKWALQSEGAQRVKAMVEMARTASGVPVDPEELDADPWLLNVANGTVDLRTGRHRPHDPADLITKVAPVVDDFQAKAPQWLAFLGQVLPDADVRDFVQRWAGYCLTGDVSEQKIVFAFGVGANGKTTLQNALARVMGDYARQAAPDLLMRRHQEPHPTGLADLHGARLVLATETTQGRHLDEALVKRLTGGDRMKARRMHGDFFEFAPSHKLVVSTNHRPAVEGTDHGIWRRIRLVPFEVVIPDDAQDRHLDEKLAAEAPGILRWAIDGCLAWQRDGLTEPNAVVAATADYRADMDTLGEFISDVCLLAPGISARAAALYSAYGTWAEAMGERPLSQRKFGLSLRERGLAKRTSNGVWWDGIGVKTGAMEPTERG
jgi:putative DNA primase/helicase